MSKPIRRSKREWPSSQSSTGETRPPYSGFPQQITIGGQLWSVVYVESVSKDEALMGAADASLRKLYLDRSLDIEAMYSTFVHEAAHAMIEQSPLRPIIQTQEVMDPEDFEECLVLWFENAVCDFIRGNQDFVKSYMQSFNKNKKKK